MPQPSSPLFGPVDNAFYFIERDETPMNIGALVYLDGQLDFEQFQKYVDSRLHLAPRYRHRVLQAPFGIGTPTWAPDPDFYIGNHVMKVALDEPGTDEQLRELVGQLLSNTLPRDKPLWEVYVIEGYKDVSCLFFKVHHCMVDGISAIELFTLMVELSPEFVLDLERKPLYDPPPLPNTPQLILDSIMQDLPYKWNMLNKVGSHLSTLGGILTDREKRLKAMIGVAHLVNDSLMPIKKLPINGKNTGRQVMIGAEFSLAEVRAVRAAANASVNEVMLCVLATALQTYTRKRSTASFPFIRILMPVNVRSDEEKGAYGNRISMLPVDVPFGLDDPIERLNTVARVSGVMKDSALSDSIDMLLTIPSLLPNPTQPLIWGLAPGLFGSIAHTWCTNVAGPQIPMYLMGHEMKHVYGYFPLNPGMGLACVVMSYNQKITMNLMLDTGIVNEAEELQHHLISAFNDLKRAAKVNDIAPIITKQVATGAPSAPTVSSPPVKSAEYVASTAPAEEVLSEDTTSMSANGHGTSASSASASSLSAPAPSVSSDDAPRLFSDEWAQAFAKVINNSMSYRKASTGWTAGSLAFVMKAAPVHGFNTPVAVLFDLHKGECRSARALSEREAMQIAAFVIEGDYAAWMEALSGKSSPFKMLANGKLKLKKGSLIRLTPHTASAQELLKCAMRVPYKA